MTQDVSIATRVAGIVNDRLHIAVENPDINLIDTGLIDSMGLVELLMALEEEFGLSVVDEDLDLDDFRTINSIASYVEERKVAVE